MTPYERIISYLDDDINRPDLKVAGVYDRRIQRSLLKFHRKEMWNRDILENTVVFTDPTQFVQEFDLRKVVRFRHMAYVRQWDPDIINYTTTPPTQGTSVGDFVECSPDKMTDYFGYDKNFVMYRAGEMLRMRSKFPMKAILVGFFIDPLLEPVANINSWIADLYPNLIATDVCVRIFKDIGKDEESKGAIVERTELEQTLFANNLRIIA